MRAARARRRHAGESRHPVTVMPAQAGIHDLLPARSAAPGHALFLAPQSPSISFGSPQIAAAARMPDSIADSKHPPLNRVSVQSPAR